MSRTSQSEQLAVWRYFWFSQLGVGVGCAAGIEWVEARFAAKYPLMHRSSSDNKELSTPKCQYYPVNIALLVKIQTIQVKSLRTLLSGRARIHIPMSHSRACVLIVHWTVLPIPSFLGSLWFAQKTWLHYSMSHGVVSGSRQ